MKKVAYMGFDVHAGNSMLGVMDEEGHYQGHQACKTTEAELIRLVQSVEAKEKYLVIEESTLAQWVSQILKPYAKEIVICDPRENRLISRNGSKRDETDCYQLCRLLRLGELKRVYHAENDDRAIFKGAVQHYLDLRNQQVSLKLKLKAMYRHWGVVDVAGTSLYSARGKQPFIDQIKQATIKKQLGRLYHLIFETEKMEELAFKEIKQLGRRYPEIKEFKRIPGIGDVGAHVFDAYIQTPHRFEKKSRLWKYCRMGIIDRSSDNKPLGYKRLDRSGVGELKALSYRAWLSGTKGDNEVRKFYERSLASTHSRTHARLNTQRKILAVMYGVWKKGDKYRSEMFLDPSR